MAGDWRARTSSSRCRLKNGLYLQLHAYMLRVAIPYGTLDRAPDAPCWATSPTAYDRGYGHFTTRQNIQYNWIKLEDAPDILADLADCRDARHPDASATASATSASDHLPAARADEIVDPRPCAELLRQWSTFHPEFELSCRASSRSR